MGARRLKTDQPNYNDALTQAQQQQTLLNIVRLRYADWPVTLNVEQLVTQYTFEQVASAKAIWRVPFHGDNDQLEAGYVGKFSERPVIAYRPLRGAEYTQAMLTPIPPAALLALVYTGWPADRMLETMLHSVNGSRNSQIEAGFELMPDLRFAHFLKTTRIFQIYDALVIDIKTPSDEQKTDRNIESRISFQTDRVDDKTRALFSEMQSSLGLNSETNSYNVTWGVVPPDNNTITLETRSVLQLMVALSVHVEVSPDEVTEGRVTNIRPKPKNDKSGLGPLISIHRGDRAPADAYVQCGYRESEYWIDDTDVNSKLTFTYLTLLLTLSETEESGAPLVITTN